MVSREFSILDFEQQPLNVAIKNEFHSLVETCFKDDSLLFAYLDLKEIYHTSGLSELYLFTDNKNILQGFDKEYAVMLEQIDKENERLYTYQGWFKKLKIRKAKGTQHLLENKEQIEFTWIETRKSRIQSDFATDIHFQDASLANYANDYFSNMQDLILNKFPYSLTVILPIYIIRNSHLIPCADLRINLGTNKEVSESTINNFIEKLKLLWNQNYGGYDVATTKDKFLDHVSMYDENLNKYMLRYPNENGKEINLLMATYLNSYANKTSFEYNKQEFLKKLEKAHCENYYDIFGQLRNLPSVNDLIKKNGIVYMSHFMLRRAFVVYLLVSKNLPVVEVRSLIIDESNKKNKVTTTELTYFNNHLHLTVYDDVEFYRNLKTYILYQEKVFEPDYIKKIEGYTKGLTSFEIETVKMFK